MTDQEVAERIRAAVLEERERCALAVEDLELWLLPTAPALEVFRLVQREAAARIRRAAEQAPPVRPRRTVNVAAIQRRAAAGGAP